MDKSMIKKNEIAWNEAFGYHKKARANSLHRNFQDANYTTYNQMDYDVGLLDRIEALKLLGKKVAHIQTNNGRELISLVRYTNALEGVGFDISSEAINEANELLQIANVNVKFECCNILDIDEKYYNYFDAVFISEGSISWFYDLEEYFNVLNKLLKVGGQILICEIHPIGFTLSDDYEPKMDYFVSQPCKLKSSLDYVGGVEYEPSECFCFMHNISDILMSLIKNNFQISFFKESNIDSGWIDSKNKNQNMPLSLQIVCEKVK